MLETPPDELHPAELQKKGGASLKNWPLLEFYQNFLF